MYKFQKLTGLLVKFLALFSKVPDVVIINSLASRDYHHKILYRPRRWEHIPNGFDLSVYKTRSQSDIDIRSELNIPSSDFLIGMIARYSSDKDHETFLRSCSLINKQLPKVQFVMIGSNVDQSNDALLNISNELNISNKVYMLGVRDEISQLISNFDVVCSSSVDEAFPNVIGEAMAAAVPCVVTDVGDCALLVGETGRIVQSGNPILMSAGCIELLSMSNEERINLGMQARNRVKKYFSIQLNY